MQKDTRRANPLPHLPPPYSIFLDVTIPLPIFFLHRREKDNGWAAKAATTTTTTTTTTATATTTAKKPNGRKKKINGSGGAHWRGISS